MSKSFADDSKFRLSDASTLDMEFSSEDELSCLKEFSSEFSPEQAIHLLDPILPQVQETYTNLQERLRDVFGILDREIQPVCIREERTLSATAVSLAGITRSSLCRRRSTLTQTAE